MQMQGNPEPELLLAEVGEETSLNIDRADVTEYQFLCVKGNYDVCAANGIEHQQQKKKKKKRGAI